MTKTILYITGTVVILATSTLLFLNKIDISTMVLFNSTVLTALYSWYTKTMLNKQEILIDAWRDEAIRLDVQNSRKDEVLDNLLTENTKLLEKLKASTEILPELEKTVEDTTETPVEKPKRVRKSKK